MTDFPERTGITTAASAIPPLPGESLEKGAYRLRFGRDLEDLDRALRLRYRVFNLELGEGLDSSRETGRDQDPFDTACHHLLVENRTTGQVVGTYRMQTRPMTLASGLGFYSAGEFELQDLGDAILDRSVEIGRACIDRDHRNQKVLFLLWKGLALYVAATSRRYLFGCCSLTGTDPDLGCRVERYLENTGYLHPELRVRPRPAMTCRPSGPRNSPARKADVPKLFRTYLRTGALVCSAPAIDRQFKTTDFLVLFDVEKMDRDLFRLYF